VYGNRLQVAPEEFGQLLEGWRMPQGELYSVIVLGEPSTKATERQCKRQSDRRVVTK